MRREEYAARIRDGRCAYCGGHVHVATCPSPNRDDHKDVVGDGVGPTRLALDEIIKTTRKSAENLALTFQRL